MYTTYISLVNNLSFANLEPFCTHYSNVRNEKSPARFVTGLSLLGNLLRRFSVAGGLVGSLEPEAHYLGRGLHALLPHDPRTAGAFLVVRGVRVGTARLVLAQEHDDAERNLENRKFLAVVPDDRLAVFRASGVGQMLCDRILSDLVLGVDAPEVIFQLTPLLVRDRCCYLPDLSERSRTFVSHPPYSFGS